MRAAASFELTASPPSLASPRWRQFIHRKFIGLTIDTAQIYDNEADMSLIAGLDRGQRLTSPKGIAPDWD